MNILNHMPIGETSSQEGRSEIDKSLGALREFAQELKGPGVANNLERAQAFEKEKAEVLAQMGDINPNDPASESAMQKLWSRWKDLDREIVDAHAEANDALESFKWVREQAN